MAKYIGIFFSLIGSQLCFAYAEPSKQTLMLCELLNSNKTPKIEEVYDLLESGLVDLNFDYKNGATALHLAVLHGHTRAAEALVHHGANLQTRTKNGYSVYHLAMFNRNFDLIDILGYTPDELWRRSHDGKSPCDIFLSWHQDSHVNLSDKVSKYLVPICHKRFGVGHSKKAINIALLGDSGFLKSSFINVLYNHVKGNVYFGSRDVVIPYEYRGIFYPVSVEKYRSSDPNQVRKYVVENERSVVTLWDIPGKVDAEKNAAILKSVSPHAIAVILTKENLNRQMLEFKVNMNQIRSVLPRFSPENIVGIFKVKKPASIAMRRFLAKEWKDFFETYRLGKRVRTYFFDNSSFLEKADGADDKKSQLGEAKWEAEASNIARMLEGISGNSVFNDEEARKDLDDKIETRTKFLLGDMQELLDIFEYSRFFQINLHSRVREDHENGKMPKDYLFPECDDLINGSLSWTYGAGVCKQIREANGIVEALEVEDAISPMLKYEREFLRSKRILLEYAFVALEKEVASLEARREELTTEVTQDLYVKRIDEEIARLEMDETFPFMERKRRLQQISALKEFYCKMRSMR